MTDLNRASIYVPITSITKADGGRTRVVTGVAGSDRLDYDGQRASYDWLKRELSAWFKVGNMRQDHRPGGVGKALSLEFDDKAKTATVTSKAVDSDTILKLDEQVLNGYSWGAKSVPGNPIRIRKDASGVEWVESGKVVEVSYVDHPANPDCFVSLVKSAGRKGLRRSAVLGDLAAGDIPGGQDFEAILKALLTDIAKRDISAAEREKLGDQGHAIDTGQDHPSYPIASAKDLQNAVSAYGRANPDDRAKLRRHIISEARRLNRTDLIPDAWKSLEAVVKQSMADCNCCDDCGPDCQGDCCDECTLGDQGDQQKAAAGPVAILTGVKALFDGETDTEYRAFLGKVAEAVDGWARAEGVALDMPSFATLTGLVKASGEADLTKRRTFYSGSNRSQVEQAMQNLHQALGLFVEGAGSFDADKDQRDNTLTGQDAPAPGDQPGGPGTAPHDGVPGDGNMAFDPTLVRDGDPAVRTPDGERDGRAQGEAGTHTWPPAGDPPGSGPGDQGKGEAPAGKGKEPNAEQAQQTPHKALKRLRRLEAEITELRKAAGQNGQPAIALQQTLGGGKKGGGNKALRAELAKTTAAVQELVSKPISDETRPLDVQAAVGVLLRKSEKRMRKIVRKQAEATGQPAAADEAVKNLRQETRELYDDLRKIVEGRVERSADEDVATATARLQKRFDKRLRVMQERLDKAVAPVEPRPDPVAEAIERLEKTVTASVAAHANGNHGELDTSLLLADLTRAAFDQVRKDQGEASMQLAKLVRRTERRLRKTVAERDGRLTKVAEEVAALGRLPRPGGPQVARPTDKNFPVNDTLERSANPTLLKELSIYKELAEATDQVVADAARVKLRQLMAGD
jgi:hypothetical protein